MAVDHILAKTAGPVIAGTAFSILGVNILEIAQVKERPKVAVSFQDDMAASASIATIGSAHGCELVAHEMLAAGSTMAAAAKNAYLVYKIAFLQSPYFYKRQIYLNGH